MYQAGGGECLTGSKCQFAHGSEELRSYSSTMNKSPVKSSDRSIESCDSESGSGQEEEKEVKEKSMFIIKNNKTIEHDLTKIQAKLDLYDSVKDSASYA